MKKVRIIALFLGVAFLISGCSPSGTNEPAKPEPANDEKQQLVALFHGIPLDVEDQNTNIFDGESDSKEQMLSK